MCDMYLYKIKYIYISYTIKTSVICRVRYSNILIIRLNLYFWGGFKKNRGLPGTGLRRSYLILFYINPLNSNNYIKIDIIIY